MKDRSESSSIYDDLMLLQPETLSLSIGSRTNKSKMMGGNHSMNLVLDGNAEDTIDCDRFARAVATMARGTLKHTQKEYPAFKQSLWESPITNPAINNTHICSEYDYHEIETKKHWEKNSGNKSMFQSGTQLNTKKFPTMTPLLGADGREPYMYEGRNGNVKMFGRTRVTTPFARTKMNICQEQEHSTELLSRHVAREVTMQMLEPNPTTYYPYPDEWQRKRECGVVKESSFFQSLSPSRTEKKETLAKSAKYIELDQNFIRQRPMTSSSIPSKRNMDLEPSISGLDSSRNRVSMSLFLSRKSGVSSNLGSRTPRTPRNVPGNVHFENVPNNVHFEEDHEDDRREGREGRDGREGREGREGINGRIIKNLILRSKESFDDSDGESINSHARKKHHNNHHNKIHNRSNRCWKKNIKRVLMNDSGTNEGSEMIAAGNTNINRTHNNKNNDNNNNNNNHDHTGNINTGNQLNSISNSPNKNIELQYNTDDKKNFLIENIRTNRNYLLSLRGEDKYPGAITIGKEFRNSTWLCSPEVMKERRDDKKDLMEKEVNFFDSKSYDKLDQGRSKSLQLNTKIGSLWSSETSTLSKMEDSQWDIVPDNIHGKMHEKGHENGSENRSEKGPESGLENGLELGSEKGHNTGLEKGLTLGSSIERMSTTGTGDFSLLTGINSSVVTSESVPVSDISFHPPMPNSTKIRMNNNNSISNNNNNNSNNHHNNSNSSKNNIKTIKKVNIDDHNQVENEHILSELHRSEISTGPTGPRPSTSPTTFEQFMPEVTSLSSSSVKRPKTAPRLFEWQPKMYQSKSILQRKFENKEQLSLLASDIVDKFNSNMIHSSVAEYMPYSSQTLKKSKDPKYDPNNGSEEEENTELEPQNSQIPKSFLARKKERKLLNDKNNLSLHRNASLSSITSLKIEETYKNRLLLPKHKGDVLGTHFTKKIDLKFLKKNNLSLVPSKDTMLKSDEILTKSSHLMN